jgi:hypothetical protein
MLTDQQKADIEANIQDLLNSVHKREISQDEFMDQMRAMLQMIKWNGVYLDSVDEENGIIVLRMSRIRTDHDEN